MTGKDLQKLVIDTARTYGWKVAHFPPISTTRAGKSWWLTPVAADGKGFPDLMLVRDRVIVAEIKGKSDRLRDEQSDWLTAFRMAGIAAHVWTLESWDGGEIQRILAARKQEPRRAGIEDIERIAISLDMPPEVLGGIPT